MPSVVDAHYLITRIVNSYKSQYTDRFKEYLRLKGPFSIERVLSGGLWEFVSKIKPENAYSFFYDRLEDYGDKIWDRASKHYINIHDLRQIHSWFISQYVMLLTYSNFDLKDLRDFVHSFHSDVSSYVHLCTLDEDAFKFDLEEVEANAEKTRLKIIKLKMKKRSKKRVLGMFLIIITLLGIIDLFIYFYGEALGLPLIIVDPVKKINPLILEFIQNILSIIYRFIGGL
ncbi:MAG: hypothetical protein ACE5R6_21570 [Candidatus Heimdallarchaeota archaeon]